MYENFDAIATDKRVKCKSFFPATEIDRTQDIRGRPQKIKEIRIRRNFQNKINGDYRGRDHDSAPVSKKAQDKKVLQTEPATLQSRIDFIVNHFPKYRFIVNHFPKVQNRSPTQMRGMFNEKLHPNPSLNLLLNLSPKGWCLS